MAKKKKRAVKKAKYGNKPAKATTKNKVGRPTKMTDDVVNKLEFAFMRGLSDQEACLYAGISKQTLYNYQESHPEFIDQKAAFKSNVKMHAKLNLAKEVIEKKNVELSLFVLERTVDEYKPKQEVSANVDMAARYAAMSDEELAQIAGKYDV
ncbi:hypothetical protein ACTPL8_000436 [Enterococcus faecium]